MAKRWSRSIINSETQKIGKRKETCMRIEDINKLADDAAKLGVALIDKANLTDNRDMRLESLKIAGQLMAARMIQVTVENLIASVKDS